LLRQVAARLSAAIRAGDTAARIGGDGFVVLCERISGVAQVREVADRIASSIGECFAIAEHRVWISASVGVTIGNGSTAREVLGRADEAMYRATRQGRGFVDVHV
jgi:diguanylate cyclase